MSHKKLFSGSAMPPLSGKPRWGNVTPGLREWCTSGGKVLKIGDRFLNAQGLILRVSAVCREPSEMDVVVEFTPCNTALFLKRWQGEFMLPAHTPASDGAPWPRVYLEDIDLMRDADEMDADPDAILAQLG